MPQILFFMMPREFSPAGVAPSNMALIGRNIRGRTEGTPLGLIHRVKRGQHDFIAAVSSP
jgi:hypothetical protein